MAWPKLRNKSSGPLMTVSNRSGAAHDGARSQGKAPEGAPSVVYLASEESVFVTGQTYAIDGGITI